jgi:hypothetical protein
MVPPTMVDTRFAAYFITKSKYSASTAKQRCSPSHPTYNGCLWVDSFALFVKWEQWNLQFQVLQAHFRGGTCDGKVRNACSFSHGLW